MNYYDGILRNPDLAVEIPDQYLKDCCIQYLYLLRYDAAHLAILRLIIEHKKFAFQCYLRELINPDFLEQT